MAKHLIFKTIVDKPHHIGFNNDARAFIGEPPVKETVIYTQLAEIESLKKKLARARQEKSKLARMLRELEDKADERGVHFGGT